MRAVTTVALLALLAIGATAMANPPCRFAPLFDGAQIVANETYAAEFLDAHATWESRFMHSLGVDPLTKLCYDGHRLSYDAGQPIHTPHLFSAPSKESIHVGVLVRVLADAASPHPKGFRSLLLYKDVKEVLEVLEKKVDALDQFSEDFPGYGGFYPWYAFKNYTNEKNETVTKIAPIENGWTNKVPALDNGELFWAAYDLAFILHKNYNDVRTKKGATLAERWDAVWQRMVKNALPVFYAGKGQVRCVTQMSNQSKPVAENNYTTGGGPCLINDPYEGELFTNMLYLFSDLPEDEKELLWVVKRNMLKSVNLTVNASNTVTNITVQRGFWFSAHEQWKYLLMPYRYSAANWAVFENGERARTWYASIGGAFNVTKGAYGGLQQPSPGMWASVNGPVMSDADNFPYDSACGIAPVSVEQITSDAVITAYSAFPLLLREDQRAGAAWLHNMLIARKGQNCWGSTESLNVTGASIAPLTTWDSKITTLLASLGGIADVTVEALGLQNFLKFVKRIDSEWERVFPDWQTLPGSQLAHLTPTTQVPALLPDFTTCNATTTIDTC